MVCPNCSAAAPDGAAECVGCGVIFAKWEHRHAAPPAPATAEAPAAAQLAGALPDLVALAPALAAAALFASFHAFRFASYLPINDGWASIEGWLLPLSSLTIAFHEAGHVILGLFGWEFLMVAGGTIFQLAFPAAIIAHFARRGERAGVLFGVFWLGESLISAAYYCADAKMQVLILITGMSGSEGGGHDWHYMLGKLGLISSCVGLGRFLFFWGCAAMALPVCLGAQALWRLAWRDKPNG